MNNAVFVAVATQNESELSSTNFIIMPSHKSQKGMFMKGGLKYNFMLLYAS